MDIFLFRPVLFFHSPYAADGFNGMFSGIVVVLIIVGILISLVPFIFYLLTLQQTLRQVRPEFRKMPPGQVWLLLIPVFSIVWQFFVISWMSESLKKEFEIRGIPKEEDRPGYSIGLAFCILSCVSFIPFLGIFTGLGAFVCWILFWVKMNDCKNRLNNSPADLSSEKASEISQIVPGEE